MKKYSFYFICIFFFFCFLQLDYAQNNNISPEKKAEVQRKIDSLNQMIRLNGFNWKAGITSLSYKSKEEIAQLCGVKIDTSVLLNLYPKTVSNNNLNIKQQNSLQKTLTITNWGDWVSKILDQGTCGGCWAYSAAFLADALLNFYYGSNVCNQIDPAQIIALASCGGCSGSSDLACGLNYLTGHKTKAKQGPTFLSYASNIYYKISSQSWTQYGSIDAIKNALQYGPVLTSMMVYNSFDSYTEGIYQHIPNEGHHDNLHAVVILGYDDANQCWICANSWGTNWGEKMGGNDVDLGAQHERGYFRIKYSDSGIGALMVTASVSSNSCLAKMVPQFQSFQTAANSPFESDERIYVSDNTSASSGTILGEMLFIDFGKTLTVGSGVTLSFAPNASLSIRGTLNATNASFSRSGSSGRWGGILFDYGSSGSLNGCTIQNVSTGITCNSVLPSITNCTFQYYNVGLTLNNVGSPSTHITGNDFLGSGQGIACYYSSPYIDGPYTGATYLYNNSIGVFGVGSSPWISYSEFHNNSIGLYLVVSSYAHIGGLNYMIGNNTAINVDGPGNVQSYTSDVYPWVQGYYAVRANQQSCYVNASDNYWGQFPPNPAHFLATNGAIIFYQPGHSSRWTNQIPKISAPGNEISDDSSEIYDNDFTLDEELLNASNLMAAKKFNESQEIYLWAFRKEGNSSVKKNYLLSQIAECYRASGENGFVDFLNKEVRPKLTKDDELIAATLELENLFLIRDHNYEKALENLNTLKTQFAKNDVTLKNSLFTMGYIHNILLTDANKGKEYFDELKEKYPDDMLTWQAKLLIGEIDSIPASKFSIPKEIVTEAKIPNKFALLDNYPNPFNPSTTISYALPYQSSVELIIFDIMGREVQSFNIPSQSSGYQNIVWDGTNEDGSSIASGVYLYQIIVKSLENNETFTKTAKLMMLK